MSKEVCLVTGVGPGTGTALVKEFVARGYQVAMLARSGDRLSKLAAERGVEITYTRIPVWAVDIPTPDTMRSILDAIERLRRKEECREDERG